MLIFTIIIGIILGVILWQTIMEKDEFWKIFGTCVSVGLIFIWIIVFSEYKSYEKIKNSDIYLVTPSIVMINPKIENNTYTIGTYTIKTETGATKINADLLLKIRGNVTVIE